MATRILIVDDHPLFRLTLRRFVESLYADACVSETDNGCSAVQYCRRQPPNIVLMDVQMPVCDGVEATQQIKSLDASIPVLLYSAETLPAVRIVQSQADAFLRKDAVFERLADEVTRLLPLSPQDD